MSGSQDSWSLWGQALRERRVLRRSLWIGCTVGAIQILVNQGDHWWRHQVDSVVVVKTLATPLIAIGVALFSAAGSYVQLMKVRSAEDTNRRLP